MKAVRDAILATLLLGLAVYAGSARGRDLDPALAGYLAATLVGCFVTTWRTSAAWRRPAAAFYSRTLLAALRSPGELRRTLAAASRDLAAQRMIARRSTPRWAAHLLLSGGTAASVAIVLPLVFGWVRFEATGLRAYRLHVLSVPTVSFDVDGVAAWLAFNALNLAAVAVVAGAAYFLARRLRTRRAGVAPLLLLLAVAITGLALPVTSALASPTLQRLAAWAHEVAVVAFLAAAPFTYLSHALIRPLGLGAKLVRAASAHLAHCGACAAPLAPRAQRNAVLGLLAAEGLPATPHQHLCPSCRRRCVATAQAALLGARFQPAVVPGQPTERAA